MDALQAGSCAEYHGNADAAYFKKIAFWKTPRKQCGAGVNGGGDTCLDYGAWQKAWQEIKG